MDPKDSPGNRGVDPILQLAKESGRCKLFAPALVASAPGSEWLVSEQLVGVEIEQKWVEPETEVVL